MTALAWGALAALGVHLLCSRRPTRRRLPTPDWPRIALLGGAAVGGLLTGLLVLGGPVSIACALLTAACAHAGRRTLAGARRDQVRRLWPGLLEELRILATGGGRSLPRALLEAGARVPPPAGAGFAAAARTWRVTGDLEPTLEVLRTGLPDGSTDLVCETLRVTHEIGGADVGRRLTRLADDRRRDLEARDLAEAKLAGARFARRFVVVVPLGMALAGQAVGTGRTAFAGPGGQLVALLAAALVAGCWVWAGHLLRLPDEPRVFAP